MRTMRGLERLVAFVDAIVAIAITLLILPVVDLVGTNRGRHTTDLFSVPLGQLGVFLLSFVVIARLWVAHHAIFEHVRQYDGALTYWTLAWALTIVFLPFPTELAVDTSGTQLSVRALYIGTMAMSSVCLAALAVVISRRPTLRTPMTDPDRAADPDLAADAASIPPFRADITIINAVVFVLAFVIAVSYRPIGYFALLILIPTGFYVRLWRSYSRRRHGPGRPEASTRA